jgi:hemolysin activation/secretion protein
MHLKTSHLLVIVALSAVIAGPAAAQPDTVVAEAAAAPAESGEVRFDIWEFQVHGNTLLETRDIERSIYGHLGPQKSIADVEAASAALEKLYRDAGYQTVFVNIPEQDVRNGIVRLEVTEGSVERVRITGSRYFSLGRIREKLPALQPGEVPNLQALQEQLTVLNQATPDREITPVMRAGKTPGTLEVELMVKDRLPLHGGLELNNRHTEDTSSLRTNATLQYDNLWQKEHSLSLFAQTAPQDTDDVKVISGTYAFRLPDDKTYVALYGVKTKSDVATAGDLSVIGDGYILGSRLILPLPGVESYLHNVILGADYKNFNNAVEQTDTPIDYINWSAQYRGTVLGGQSRTNFGIGVNFGIRGVVNNEGEFSDKRFNGKPNYAYLVGSADHLHKLPGSFGIFASLSGQLADSPLIDNEQFSAGGATSVRGYYESQELGDDALQGTLELRTPSLVNRLPDYVDDLYFHAFLDGAKLWVKDPLPGQKDHFELAGTGIGMRVEMLEDLRGALDTAWALQDDASVERGDNRTYFSVEYEF